VQIPFTVAVANLPITIGIPVKKTEAITSTANLVIKAPGGGAIPGGFRVLSRWEGLPGNGALPIKWVLCDFQPTVTGAYTLEDTGSNPAAPALTVTDNVGDLQVATGNIDVRIAKTGNDLITSFLLNAVEQLAAGSKPRLLGEGPADITAVILQPDGTGGNGPMANAGATSIRVTAASGFQVGDDIEFFWEAKFSHFLSDAIVWQAGEDYGTWYQTSTSPLREFTIARGLPRELQITTFQFPFGTALFRSLPYGSDGYTPALANLVFGDLIEDDTSAQESVKTITAIDGPTNTITFTPALTNESIYNGKIRKVTGGAAQSYQAKATITTIEEQNPMRVVIKQYAEFNLVSDGTNPIPKMKLCLRYYFYAGKNYVRVRYHQTNAEQTLLDEFAIDVQWDSLRFTFPTADPTTPSDDNLITYTGANSASDRIESSNDSSSATAGDFVVAVAEFAQNFPQRLAAAGSAIDYYIHPVIPGFAHTFFKDWQKTWEFYIGENADAALPITSTELVRLNPTYVCDSKAVRHALTPIKAWTSPDFGGNAEMAEAANRAERLLAIGYDFNACDAVPVSGNPRMSFYEWRLSDHDHPSGSNHFGQHIGWQYFGNTRDGDSDGYTFNRYDVGFIFLREWLRGASGLAWRLGVEQNKYMGGSGGGTWPAATMHNGEPTYLYKGLSRYERSPLLTTGLQTPRPTHSWGEGVWLYAVLTGDPIAFETANLRRERVRTWNYQGIYAVSPAIVDLSMAFGEIRAVGWAALEALTGYRYGGDNADMVIAKQYIDNLRLSEESGGNRGFLEISPGAQQVDFMYGYISVGICEYIREKRFQGAPDVDVENFLNRMAKYLLRGDANLTLPGNNKPLIGGFDIPGGNYQPIGLPYFWSSTGTTTSEVPTVSYVDLVAVLLVNAADLFLRADFRQKADTIFKDVVFYRDFGDGPLLKTARGEINLRNSLFFGSSLKTWGQTGLALADYLPIAAANLALNPPVLTSLLPITVNQGIDHVITLTGTGFEVGAQVSVDSALVVPTSITPTEIVFTLTAGMIAGLGTVAVAVLNANGGFSATLSITVQSALAPAFTSMSPTFRPQNGGAFVITLNGANFQSGAKLVWGVGGPEITTAFVSTAQLTATVPAPQTASVGVISLRIKNPDDQLSPALDFTVNNNVPAITSMSPSQAPAGSLLQTVIVSGTNFAPDATASWDGATALVIAVTNINTAIVQIPAGLIVAAGAHLVTISNPAPGGGASAPSTFTVTVAGAPAPVINGLSPASAVMGAAQFTLTVNGSNFQSGATVRWNGVDLATVYVSSTQLTATVPAANVLAPGTAIVTVRNADAQLSNNFSFPVTSQPVGGGTGLVFDVDAGRAVRTLLVVMQGDTWESPPFFVKETDGTPTDLTGFTAKAQVRDNVADNQATVLVEFLLGQGITIDPGLGMVQMSLSALQSSALKFYRALWDLQITDPTGLITHTIAEGEFRVKKEVTR